MLQSICVLDYSNCIFKIEKCVFHNLPQASLVASCQIQRHKPPIFNWVGGQTQPVLPYFIEQSLSVFLFVGWLVCFMQYLISAKHYCFTVITFITF